MSIWNLWGWLETSAAPSQQVKPFHTWMYQGRVFDFFASDDEISLKVTKKGTELFSGPVILPNGNLPISDLDSFEQKFAPSIWRNDPSFILCPIQKRHYTWISGDASISLISAEHKLFWKYTVDQVTNWVRSAGLVAKPKDTQVSWDKDKNQPIIATNPTYGQWLCDGVEITLIKDEANCLFWQQVNPELKTKSWCPVTYLDRLPLVDRVSRLMVQRIHSHSGNLAIEQIDLVTLERLQSKLDPQTTATAKSWAVTLIDIGGSACSSVCGHARIIVEGIQGQLPFILSMDFSASGKVRIYDLSPFETIKCKGKTNTHLISKAFVQAMLLIVRKERDATAIEPLRFSLRGYTQVSAQKANNCMSWAREKLSLLGIQLRKGPLWRVADYPKLATQ